MSGQTSSGSCRESKEITVSSQDDEEAKVMSRYNINYYAARSGRVIKEDGTYVNVADGLNEDGSQNARIIYGPDGQPLSESNPLPVQLKGSNVRKVFRPLIFGGDEVIEVTTEGRVQ